MIEGWPGPTQAEEALKKCQTGDMWVMWTVRATSPKLRRSNGGAGKSQA
ncbi:hypothetical protein KTAU_11080 [Thermogemmatispora aurantia]|uniref:Uncharacterized protein n=1 Tax=Thermogemmatispora aurantia TaxID=2045279 RepID=A0A5J4K6Z5_9CHLR|nr:hypothetical protein KTAU_11080 [Thermogemmatispora aurantia]